MQLLAHLKVADYDAWRRTFDDDAEARGNAGITLLQLWRQRHESPTPDATNAT